MPPKPAILPPPNLSPFLDPLQFTLLDSKKGDLFWLIASTLRHALSYDTLSKSLNWIQRRDLLQLVEGIFYDEACPPPDLKEIFQAEIVPPYHRLMNVYKKKHQLSKRHAPKFPVLRKLPPSSEEEEPRNTVRDQENDGTHGK
jgi:hypothetical protein